MDLFVPTRGQSRTGSISRGSRLSPFPYARESRTRHCRTGFLRVRVRDLIKFPMGHPCPPLFEDALKFDNQLVHLFIM